MRSKSLAFSGLLAAAAVAFALAGSATAADKLSGAQIKATVAGNTVQGKMEGTGPYAEFYDKNGTIKGEGYVGAWTIEGDTMCFQYGSDPKACYGVAKDGGGIQWIKDGKVDGTGTVAPGNPNNY